MRGDPELYQMFALAEHLGLRVTEVMQMSEFEVAGWFEFFAVRVENEKKKPRKPK